MRSIDSILKDLNKTYDRAKRFLELDMEDLNIIRKNKDFLFKKYDKIISNVVKSLLNNKETIEGVDLTEDKITELLKRYYTLTIEEGTDPRLVKKIMKIGLAHIKREIPPSLMVLTMGAFIRETLRNLVSSGKSELILPIFKCHFLMLHIMLEAYNKAQLLSLEKATKISESLYKRLISLKAEEVCNKLIKYISTE